MVTSGGWAYCEQVRALARRTGYTLLCGRYANDGYTGPGLRAERHLDWGNPAYLDSLARKVRAAHRRVGGELVLIGVSYSGFGVATLASHHPELQPDRLIAIDTYLELVPRRAALPASHQTARDIDAETSGSRSELEARSVSAAGLARLVRTGTSLAVIWSIAPEERREFNGATCDRRSNAGMLAKLAGELGKPVTGWVSTGTARPQPLGSRHRHRRGTSAGKAVHVHTRRPDSARVGVRMSASAVRQEQSLERWLEAAVAARRRALGHEDLLRLVCGIGVAREAWSPFVHHDPAAHQAVCLHKNPRSSLARLLARRPIDGRSPARGQVRLRVCRRRLPARRRVRGWTGESRVHAQLPAPQEHGVLLHGQPGAHDAPRWASPRDLAARVCTPPA